MNQIEAEQVYLYHDKRTKEQIGGLIGYITSTLNLSVALLANSLVLAIVRVISARFNIKSNITPI